MKDIFFLEQGAFAVSQGLGVGGGIEGPRDGFRAVYRGRESCVFGDYVQQFLVRGRGHLGEVFIGHSPDVFRIVHLDCPQLGFRFLVRGT